MTPDDRVGGVPPVGDDDAAAGDRWLELAELAARLADSLAVLNIRITQLHYPEAEVKGIPAHGWAGSDPLKEETMGLRINQNIAAMNAYRNLTVTEGQMS